VFPVSTDKNMHTPFFPSQQHNRQTNGSMLFGQKHFANRHSFNTTTKTIVIQFTVNRMPFSQMSFSEMLFEQKAQNNKNGLSTDTSMHAAFFTTH
jgi:hypothetical protein